MKNVRLGLILSQSGTYGLERKYTPYAFFTSEHGFCLANLHLLLEMTDKFNHPVGTTEPPHNQMPYFLLIF